MTKTRSASKSNSVRKPTTHSVSRKTNVISRVFYEDRLEGYKTPRLTAIMYEYDPLTGETRYGASLFREQIPREFQKVFGSKQKLRAALRQTAMTRLKTKPVTLKMTHIKSIKDFHHKLRKAVATLGVCS
jgi:hypothetical protein